MGLTKRVVVVTVAAAAVAAKSLAEGAAPFKLHGINYNIRAGPDWAPPQEKCKSPDVIQRELETLKGVTDNIRLYSLTDCDQANSVVPAAVAAGLKVELGLWVGPDKKVFEQERDKLKELLKRKDIVNTKNIIGVHVGSEAIYRRDVDAATAIKYYKEVKAICSKANLKVPMSIGDIGDTYIAHPELIKEVDFVSANFFPFWESVEAKDAARHFEKRFKVLQDAAAKLKKAVVVGETGWPTAGKQEKASVASPQNAARFFKDFYKFATKNKLKYFYFAAFDEPWKIRNEDPDNTVEAYFGLFDAQGNLKPEYASIKVLHRMKKTKEADQVKDIPAAADDDAEMEGNPEKVVHVSIHLRHRRPSMSG